MPNTNGLTSIAPVFNTGSEDSGFWAKKDRPEFVGGFVTLVSPDGSNFGTIEESNGGDLKLTTGGDSTFGDIILQNTGDIYLQPGTTLGEEPVTAPRAVYVGLTQPGAVLIIKNENAGVADGTSKVILEDTSSNGKTFEMASTANTFFISDIEDTESILTSTGAAMTLLSTSAAPVITIGTDSGQLYDTVYNKPPGLQSVTSIATYTGVPAPIVVDSSPNTLTAGTYQLQMFAETIVPVAGTRLLISAVLSSGAGVINFSTASISDSGDATINVLSLNSGYFNVPITADYRFLLEATSGNWTATEWGLQLIKIA